MILVIAYGIMKITKSLGVDDLGYRLWDYENHKIIRSRDVVFNENMYNDHLQGKKHEKSINNK